MIMNEAFKSKLTDIPCPCASPPLKKTKQKKTTTSPARMVLVFLMSFRFSSTLASKEDKEWLWLACPAYIDMMLILKMGNLIWKASCFDGSMKCFHRKPKT